MKLRILPMVAVTVLLACCAYVGYTATASAHRTVGQQTAETRVYDHYNHLCGTVAWGWTWCSARRVSLWGTPLGDHSWSVRYTWNEAKIGTTYGCGIVVQYYTHTGGFTVLDGPSCAV